jgi:hypothetical protein
MSYDSIATLVQLASLSRYDCEQFHEAVRPLVEMACGQRDLQIAQALRSDRRWSSELVNHVRGSAREAPCWIDDLRLACGLGLVRAWMLFPYSRHG